MRISSTSIRAEKAPTYSNCASSPASIEVRGEADGLARPLRIMHVFDRLDVGGTEKAVMKLVRGLEPAEFEHFICTMRGGAAAGNEWVSGVTVLHAGRAGAGLQFNVPRLVRIMRKIRPAIVHSRNWGGIEAVVAARLARVPIAVHSEHGYELEMLSGLPFHRRVLRHFVYRMAGAVAAVSDELRDYHAAQAWWSPATINVLYNGVDGHEFSPQPQVRDAVRRRLDIPIDALVVGSVGRMVPVKDFMTLLKAAEALAPEIPNLRVLLVGSGPELSRLQDYVNTSAQLAGRVVFPGAVDCVPRPAERYGHFRAAHDHGGHVQHFTGSVSGRPPRPGHSGRGQSGGGCGSRVRVSVFAARRAGIGQPIENYVAGPATASRLWPGSA